jgi:hypothetical protein
MATETLTPNAVIAGTKTGFQGTDAANITSVSADDTNYVLATNNNTSGTIRFGFPTPTDNLTSAATQTLTVIARQFDEGQSGTPQIQIFLYESGNVSNPLVSGTLSNVNTGDNTYSITFTDADLVAVSGVDVEIEIDTTKSGGSPSARNAVNIDYVKWDVDYTVAVGSDDLLADDVESASETGTTALGQEHNLLADDTESASELTTPALAQSHALAAGGGGPPGAFVDYGTGVNKSTEIEATGVWTSINHSGANTNDENTPVGTIEATADRRVSTNAVENVSRRFYDDFSFTADADTYWRVSGYFTTSSDQWWKYPSLSFAFDAGYSAGVTYDLVTQTNTVESVGANGTAGQLVDHGAETTGIFSSDGEEWIRIWLIVKNEGLSHTTPRVTINFSHDSDGSASLSQNTTDWFCASRTMVEEVTLGNLESLTEVSAPALVEAAAPDDLLADDVESASELTIPAIGQEHTILADDTQSLSEVSAPAVGQEHIVLADDVEATSEVTAPALTSVAGQDSLLADDVEAASEVTTSALGQEHVVLGDDVEAASEVETSALGQAHSIFGDDVQSTSEVSTPPLAQVHNIFGDDVDSTSEVSTPATTVTSNLLGDDTESASEVTTNTLAQVHVLFADDTESTS